MPNWFTASTSASSSAGGAITGSSLVVTGNVTAGAAGVISWSGLTQLTAPVDGVVRITKADGTTTAAVSGVLIGTNDATANGVRMSRNVSGYLEVTNGNSSADTGVVSNVFLTSSSDGTIKYGNANNGMAIGSNTINLQANATKVINFDTNGRAQCFRSQVASKTTNYNVTTSVNFDSFTVFDNAGAAGTVVFTLPPVSQGLGQIYTFTSTAAQVVTVTAGAGDKIGSKAAASSYSCAASQGNSITVVAVSANMWAVTSNIGFT